MRPTSAEARILARIQRKENGCWLYPLRISQSGYTMISVRTGKRQRHHVPTHRFMYELVNGPTPEGLQIHHLCYTRNCVRPSHLQAVTPRENVLDPGSRSPSRINSERTHCIRGHAFSDDNTYRHEGRRRCVICARNRTRESLRRRRRAKKLLQEAL